MAAVAAAALTSCSDEEPMGTTGEGTVYLSASVNSDVKVRSRATLDELRQSAMVWISNSKGVVRRYDAATDIPAGGIKLLSDSYVAEAWAGDSVPASWTERYFKGSQDFTIASGDRKSVEVVCKIANTVVAVDYDATIDQVLEDYTLTVGHSQGELIYEGRTEARGYFMMNSRDKDLIWTITGTLKNGQAYTHTEKIEACKPATLYTLHIKCSESSEEIGGGYLTIEIDESAVDVEDEIKIVAAPEVRGLNANGTLYTLPETVRGKKGEIGTKAMWITASTRLDKLILSCDYFNALLGLDPGVSDFDLLYADMPDALRQNIAAAGIKYELNYDDTADETTVKLTFGEAFTDALPDGTYTLTAEAVDVNGKSASGTLTIVVTDAPVTAEPAEESAVWATKATISAVINKADAVNPRLLYRKQGVTAWTEAQSKTVSRALYLTAELTDLEPATTYEYCAATDSYFSDILTFTTEGTAQLPNSGFEEWCTVDKEIVAAPSDAERFWGTGNPGANTLGKNITTSDGSVKHSGSFSAKLASEKIVIKFAAGNIFVGEYLATVGMDGVLGWGRPWNARPAKLRGWVKYSPKTVDNTSSDYTALKKGDMDNGIIYIALLDDSKLQDYDGKKYPEIIKTASSSRQLFDKNGSNVIAYGEIKFTEATAGDGMVEFEIPIEYKKLNVKPSYIMCTASASIGGDYFVGGTGSTMWLDDLELVY